MLNAQLPGVLQAVAAKHQTPEPPISPNSFHVDLQTSNSKVLHMMSCGGKSPDFSSLNDNGSLNQTVGSFKLSRFGDASAVPQFKFNMDEPEVVSHDPAKKANKPPITNKGLFDFFVKEDNHSEPANNDNYGRSNTPKRMTNPYLGEYGNKAYVPTSPAQLGSSYNSPCYNSEYNPVSPPSMRAPPSFNKLGGYHPSSPKILQDPPLNSFLPTNRISKIDAAKKRKDKVSKEYNQERKKIVNASYPENQEYLMLLNCDLRKRIRLKIINLDCGLYKDTAKPKAKVKQLQGYMDQNNNTLNEITANYAQATMIIHDEEEKKSEPIVTKKQSNPVRLIDERKKKQIREKNKHKAKVMNKSRAARLQKNKSPSDFAHVKLPNTLNYAKVISIPSQSEESEISSFGSDNSEMPNGNEYPFSLIEEDMIKKVYSRSTNLGRLRNDFITELPSDTTRMAKLMKVVQEKNRRLGHDGNFIIFHDITLASYMKFTQITPSGKLLSYYFIDTYQREYLLSLKIYDRFVVKDEKKGDMTLALYSSDYNGRVVDPLDWYNDGMLQELRNRVLRPISRIAEHSLAVFDISEVTAQIARCFHSQGYNRTFFDEIIIHNENLSSLLCMELSLTDSLMMLRSVYSDIKKQRLGGKTSDIYHEALDILANNKANEGHKAGIVKLLVQSLLKEGSFEIRENFRSTIEANINKIKPLLIDLKEQLIVSGARKYMEEGKVDVLKLFGATLLTLVPIATKGEFFEGVTSIFTMTSDDDSDDRDEHKRSNAPSPPSITSKFSNLFKGVVHITPNSSDDEFPQQGNPPLDGSHENDAGSDYLCGIHPLVDGDDDDKDESKEESDLISANPITLMGGTTVTMNDGNSLQISNADVFTGGIFSSIFIPETNNPKTPEEKLSVNVELNESGASLIQNEDIIRQVCETYVCTSDEESTSLSSMSDSSSSESSSDGDDDEISVMCDETLPVQCSAARFVMPARSPSPVSDYKSCKFLPLAIASWEFAVKGTEFLDNSDFDDGLSSSEVDDQYFSEFDDFDDEEKHEEEVSNVAQLGQLEQICVGLNDEPIDFRRENNEEGIIDVCSRMVKSTFANINNHIYKEKVKSTFSNIICTVSQNLSTGKNSGLDAVEKARLRVQQLCANSTNSWMNYFLGIDNSFRGRIEGWLIRDYVKLKTNELTATVKYYMPTLSLKVVVPVDEGSPIQLSEINSGVPYQSVNNGILTGAINIGFKTLCLSMIGAGKVKNKIREKMSHPFHIVGYSTSVIPMQYIHAWRKKKGWKLNPAHKMINPLKVRSFDYQRVPSGVGCGLPFYAVRNYFSVPWSIAEDTVENRWDTEVQRQCGTFGEVEEKAMEELEVVCDAWLEKTDINNTVTPTLQEYCDQSTSLSPEKKRKLLEQIPFHPVDNMNQSQFVKKEFLNKPPYDIPRAIHTHKDQTKATLGPIFKGLSGACKEKLLYDPEHPYKNLWHAIWTGGRSPKWIGKQFTWLMKKFKAAGIKPAFLSIDFEKYDSSQKKKILKLLKRMYQKLYNGPYKKVLLDYIDLLCGYKKTISVVNYNKQERLFYIQLCATRGSGDSDTTVSNTLLTILLTYWMLSKRLRTTYWNFCWSFNTGDDILLVVPEECRGDVNTDIVKRIGMRVTVESTLAPSLIDYNSRFMLRMFDEETKEVRYHLTVKVGKILTKGPLTHKNLSFRKMFKLAYEKYNGNSNELQHMPFLRQSYVDKGLECLKLASGVNLSETEYKKPWVQTKCEMSPCPETYEDLEQRYGLERSQFRRFERFMCKLSIYDYVIEDHPNFSSIARIVYRIFLADLKNYSIEQVSQFRVHGYPEAILSRYEKWYQRRD